jgi:hypothetical protein
LQTSGEGTEIMDERQQRQINEAAEKFAEAIKDSYQAIADRSVSAQEINAQLTQDFFNRVIDNLRTQAESNRALAEDLIELRYVPTSVKTRSSLPSSRSGVRIYFGMDPCIPLRPKRAHSSHRVVSGVC